MTKQNSDNEEKGKPRFFPEDILTAPRIVELSDGREVTANLYELTRNEWIELWGEEQSTEEGDAMLARVYGLKVKEIGELKFPDYRKLIDRLRIWGKIPYDIESSKNSESALSKQ